MARSSNNCAKYERQKELARERQRRRRAKLSEEKQEEKKKYDRERMAKLRAEKKIKKVADMTERERRKARKYWKERNKIRRQKKQALAEVLADTPPHSPNHPNQQQESSQRKSGRKKVRRDKAKAYKTVKKQQKEIKDLKRRLERYKKRLSREKQKHQSATSPSPKKQVNTLLGSEKVSHNVRKQLFLGFALRKQIEHQKKSIKGTKKRNQHMRKVVGNKVIKKLRVQTYFKDLVPYKANKMLKNVGDPASYTRKLKDSVSTKLAYYFKKFYEQDSISRMCPGKRDYIKKGAIKKQRRVLLHPLKDVHKMFQTEYKCKVSLATFARARPFWVSFPKKSDRETCACIRHSNMALMVSALNQAKVITENKPSQILKLVTCSTERLNCMLGDCENCKEKFVVFNNEEDFKMKYFKWKNVTEEKIIKNEKKTVKRTMKVKELKTVSEIRVEFEKELKEFKKHVFFAEHQTKEISKKIDNLNPNELLFRIDFSENYVTKLSHEIQSYHFGASKRQLSLHTGVRYNSEEGEIKTVCFASVSDNIDHQSHAIWAHMVPFIELSSQQFPSTTAIHFVSDSPSNQYRNRSNLHLFKTIVQKYFKNIEYLTWNFTEAGHGKGAMDGVGGTLKRVADTKVAYGTDISSAKDFVNVLSDTNIFVYEVPSKNIENMKVELSSMTLPLPKGIMKVHQVVFSASSITANKLSCFQCSPERCQHYILTDVVFTGSPLMSLQEQIRAKNMENPRMKKKTILRVEDIYSSSEDEDVFETSNEVLPTTAPQTLAEKYIGEKRKEVFKNVLDSGKFVVVELSNKKLCQQFIGICQSKLTHSEIDVMFMKSTSKDNELYLVNETDLSSVNIDQIRSLLDEPLIIMKGNRLYYKFKKPKRNM